VVVVVIVAGVLVVTFMLGVLAALVSGMGLGRLAFRLGPLLQLALVLAAFRLVAFLTLMLRIFSVIVRHARSFRACTRAQPS
jgi:hypothetical protein